MNDGNILWILDSVESDWPNAFKLRCVIRMYIVQNHKNSRKNPFLHFEYRCVMCNPVVCTTVNYSAYFILLYKEESIDAFAVCTCSGAETGGWGIYPPL